MPRILTRLRKLEVQLTDHRGLVPHTQAWRDYWLPKVDSLIRGEPSEPIRIPLEVIDAVVAGDRRGESR